MDISQILPPSVRWLTATAPAFPLDSKQIEIIVEPRHFYNTLLEKTYQAKKRITFASLYLGSGKLEQELVRCMHERLVTTPELEVLWLIDWTRGSRMPASSRDTLLPLLQHQSCQVSLFHTPELRGLLKLLLPQRWNEIIALQHMKLYIFDDTLLISGANLSADYFTNRQDRYFLISQAPELSDFFNRVVATVARHSLMLLPDGGTVLHPYAPRHPVRDSYQSYCGVVEADLRAVWDSAVRQSALRLSASPPMQGAGAAAPSPDTVVFPSLQMRSFNINYDANMTERLLQSAGPESIVHLASGYFNLTKAYMKCLLQATAARFSVLCAHPKANGFLGAAGVAGAIPAAYTLLAKQFLTRVERLGQQSRVQLHEYQRDNWTFHAKGLWYSEHSYSDLASGGALDGAVGDQCLPCLTLIGSPNFGWRSVHRDLESQVVVVTCSPALQRRLAEERDLLYQRAALVHLHTTYSRPCRRVQFWVRFVVPLIKRFF